jgi:glutaredoxin
MPQHRPPPEPSAPPRLPQAGPTAGRGGGRPLLGLVVLVLVVSAASQWWAGHRERQTGRQVAALAQPGDIRMLSSESCGICVVARQWFTDNQVAFDECLIERDAACRAAFEAQGAPGTPVLIVRGRAQLGFNPQRLHQRLAGQS